MVLSKAALAERIWAETVRCQRHPRDVNRPESGLPDMIPAGDGRSIVISSELGRDLASFAKLVHDAGLQVSHTRKEVLSLVREGFGLALASRDIDDDPTVARDALLSTVADFLKETLSASVEPLSFAFGCWLVRDDIVPDVRFGPVRFETRQRWLDRLRSEQRVPARLHGRITRRWAGHRLRPLKQHYQRAREEALLETVGGCPMVCSVATSGLAREAAAEKAVLAARLSMAAFALLWELPAKPLNSFGLLTDGNPRSSPFLMLTAKGDWGTRHAKLRTAGSAWMTADDWTRLGSNLNWLTVPVGEALTAVLRPDLVASRPKLSLSLWHALWWLHEAAKAETPLMATVKYGACLDALGGGKSDANIMKLIEARLGMKMDAPLTTDGRSARSVVRDIFKAGRSQTIHGTNEQHAHDWTSTRDVAEHLTRLCLVHVFSWLEDHPDALELSGALA